MAFKIGKNDTQKRLSELLNRVHAMTPPPPPARSESSTPAAPAAPAPSPPPAPTPTPAPAAPIPAPAPAPQPAPTETPPQAIEVEEAPAGAAAPAAPAAPKPSPAPAPKPEAKPAPKPAAKPAETKPAQAPVVPDDDAPPSQVDGRIRDLEESMKGLQELRELSEILSVKYNPFLSFEEQSTEDGYTATGLLKKQIEKPVRKDPALDAVLRQEKHDRAAPQVPLAPESPTPEPAPEPVAAKEPEPPVVRGTPPTAGKTGGAIRSAKDILGKDGIDSLRFDKPYPKRPRSRNLEETMRLDTPQPAAPEAPALPRQPEAPQEGFPAMQKRMMMPSGNERALFQSRGQAMGGPRESFLAMNWFQYLGDGTDPSIIFLYLDYYLYNGWIDDTSHAWLYRLAEGLASPKDGAKWEDFGMDLSRLADKHLRNLRFLDKLLGTTLQHGEADYLQQTLDLLMED